MLRQASRLSTKMTGNPAFCAGRSHQQSPKPRDCLPRFSGGRNDILWQPVTERLREIVSRIIQRQDKDRGQRTPQWRGDFQGESFLSATHLNDELRMGQIGKVFV